MKKNFTILVAFIFVLGSCNREAPEPNSSPSVSDVAMEDASAAGQSFAQLAFQEPELLIGCPECIAAESAFDGALASWLIPNSIVEPSPAIPISGTLPINLMIKEDPYESIGKMHNIVLEYAVKNISRKEFTNISDFNNKYSPAIINNLLSTSNWSQKGIPELSNNIELHIQRNAKVTESVILKNEINMRENVGTNVEIFDDIKSYSNSFLKKIKHLPKDDLINNINFINKEIINESCRKEDEKIKTGRLVFLSVYKHSYYFWNKNSKLLTL